MNITLKMTPFFSDFQDGQYVMEKDFEGVGLTPYSPYHNSSFVYSGKYN